jgi:hypothetical protein
LPGTTLVAGGRWGRLSDAAVAFDPKHGVWLISSLGIGGKAGTTGVLVSRSTQGGTVWNDPVTITMAAGRQHLDKDWITCDGSATSRYYGNCYAEWDDSVSHDLVWLSTSFLGGLAFPVLAVATAPTSATFDESMNTPAAGIAVGT